MGISIGLHPSKKNIHIFSMSSHTEQTSRNTQSTVVVPTYSIKRKKKVRILDSAEVFQFAFAFRIE